MGTNFIFSADFLLWLTNLFTGEKEGVFLSLALLFWDWLATSKHKKRKVNPW